jgi:hypothetical protein
MSSRLRLAAAGYLLAGANSAGGATAHQGRRHLSAVEDRGGAAAGGREVTASALIAARSVR